MTNMTVADIIAIANKLRVEKNINPVISLLKGFSINGDIKLVLASGSKEFMRIRVLDDTNTVIGSIYLYSYKEYVSFQYIVYGKTNNGDSFIEGGDSQKLSVNDNIDYMKFGNDQCCKMIKDYNHIMLASIMDA